MVKRREFRERVGVRIRARRTEAGLSQSQLARKLPGHVEGSQISRWERGETFPTYANVLALARALGISEELLIAGVEPTDDLATARGRRAANG